MSKQASNHENDTNLYLGDEMEDTITQELDDIQVECGIIASFPLDNKDYVALLPLQPVDGLDEDEILLYAYTRDGEDFQLLEITDDDEFDRVADAFDELLDEAAFNDMEEN